MVSFKKLAMPVVAGMLLLGGLAACDREGPMERAGEKVYRSVERAGETVERARDTYARGKPPSVGRESRRTDG